jgi:phospholipid/cholesterol/gamma-HCH transport system ATP-binding protein
MTGPLFRIEFRDVVLAYDDKPVLDGMSFGVWPGELKGILGGSGSGKSTVIKLALGLIQPDAGQVLIDGIDITKLTEVELNEIRRRMGVVFQDGALFSSLTVYENVAFRPLEIGWDEKRIDREVKRVLKFVGLLDAAEKYPEELSGGMRRRVAIARALVDRPDMIFFDEPTAGLDPPTARSICELVIKLRDVEGVTSLFVTHQLDDMRLLASSYFEVTPDGHARLRSEADRLCLINTRFIFIEKGKVIFDGTDEQLWSSTNPRIRHFLLADEHPQRAYE